MVALQSILAFATVGCACAETFLKETFDDTWQTRWKHSEWKKKEGTAGEFTLTAGKFYGNEKQDMGIQTGPDARFYSIYSPLEKPFSNEGKSLVLQFSVKHEQSLDCGGGYIKLIPDTVSDADMENFSGETPYSIMFGPDICGFSTKKVHVILTKNGKNHLIEENIPCETDVHTHVYTLAISPDNSYEVYIDTESVKKGTLQDHWKILPPKEIPDPEAKKPEDWEDDAMIPDPEDAKPDDWDDIPKMIPDPEATKPEEWDEKEEGEWTAPEIPNPEYKGEWRPKMIENPKYKGPWSAPKIANPDFVDDPSLYVLPPTKYVGFELWQVKSGSIFDNIMLTDSLDEALKFAKETWGASIEGEKAMKTKLDEEEAAKTKAPEDDSDEYVDPVDPDAEKGDKDEL